MLTKRNFITPTLKHRRRSGYEIRSRYLQELFKLHTHAVRIGNLKAARALGRLIGRVAARGMM